MDSSPLLQTYCTAPAKLILSGEHAVLYGCPALSMAVDLFSHCHIQVTPAQNQQFQIDLPDLSFKNIYSKTNFDDISQQIETRFQQFKAQAIQIDQVLQTPADLILMTLFAFQQQHYLAAGNWQIEITSEVPVSRGLGSSASVIISLLKSLYHIHQLEPDSEQIMALAKQVESYQHGRSSGLDPATILNGGLIQYQANQPLTQQQITPPTLYLIDTGIPESSTGQAVVHVSQYAEKLAVWQQFTAVSNQLKSSLSSQDTDLAQQAIKHNQSLLEQIGVVPNRVKAFIAELHQQDNTAAKVCGSGSVLGDGAGVVLCIANSPPSDLCDAYNYSYQEITLNQTGATCR